MAIAIDTTPVGGQPKSTDSQQQTKFWNNPVKAGWTKISISTIVLIVAVVVIVKLA